jgi:hypothetical protein
MQYLYIEQHSRQLKVQCCLVGEQMGRKGGGGFTFLHFRFVVNDKVVVKSNWHFLGMFVQDAIRSISDSASLVMGSCRY